jgi:hypothetical protein
MSNLNLPKGLRHEVLIYIQNTHNTQERQTELSKFMSSISPSFQVKCRSKIFCDFGEQNFIFRELIDTFMHK